MDITARFIASCARGAACSEPAIACAKPGSRLAGFVGGLDAATQRKLMYSTDVLGTCCSVAAQLGLTRLGSGASVGWGVADVRGVSTICIWDGQRAWVQGARGAVALRSSHVVQLWSFD